MAFSPNLSSAFNRTTMRDEKHGCALSGMCSLCSADCVGSCEIGQSAVRGMDMVYPTTTGDNSVASEKNYPIDYSHFNISGRSFGVSGAEFDANKATIYHVNTAVTIGKKHAVKLALPIVLPAMVKMNYMDYYAGAAMAGVLAVIGEGAVSKDPELKYEGTKVVYAQKVKDMIDSFNAHYRGFGQIVLQINFDDDLQGVPEYALQHCGCKAFEFKFGQSAKGTQPVGALKNIEAARAKKAQGVLVLPDPDDEQVAAKYALGQCETFRTYGRLPLWSDEYIVKRFDELRALGAENFYFKTAGFDIEDLEHVLRLAAKAGVDMVTFDGAGGGSGYSPAKMMNEWSLPTVCMESALVTILAKLEAESISLPAVAVTGGFVMEDTVYKALALGAPHIKIVGIGRAAMAAANVGKKIGELIDAGNLPQHLATIGTTKQALFSDFGQLRSLYGEKADGFTTGAIGVYSYLNRVGFGLRHFAALNRKFDLGLADKRDLIPLTADAKELYKGTWFDYLD